VRGFCGRVPRKVTGVLPAVYVDHATHGR
jgi:hypothetical protein